LPGLALTLNNLGILDSTQGRRDDARQHYEEALKTYRQLAQENPDTYPLTPTDRNLLRAGR
jgi:tetratricopeptide (TPR) repeat protein